jgi:hypothetical protein
MENEKDMPLFTIVKDKNGFEHKVVNFDNPIYAPFTGKIEIAAIRVTKRHENFTRWGRAKDPQTGIIYGIVTGVDEKTNQLKYQPILLGDGLYLDLSNTLDRKKYIVLKHANFMVGSPFQSGKPKYKIVDYQEEAKKTILLSKKRRIAEDVIDTLNAVEIFDMCRCLELNVEHSSLEMATSDLIKVVNLPGKQGTKSGGERFMDIWDNIHRPILVMIKRCMATGVIKFSMTDGYVTKNGMPLGLSEPQVIKYLLSNTTVLLALDNESKELDLHMKNSKSSDEYKNAIMNALTTSHSAPEHTSMFTEKEMNKAEARLHEENQIKEKALEEKHKKADDLIAKLEATLKGASVDTTPKDDTVTPELLEKAKSAGIKSPHLYKSKEKLEKEIADLTSLNFDKV